MELHDLLGSPLEPVKTAAELLVRYAAELQQGAITKDEFNDLVQDATNLEHISQDATTVEERKMIQEAFQAILAIASMVK